MPGFARAIVRTVCTEGIFQAAPTATRKEAAFALRLMDKKTDLIPGWRGGGDAYADDSLIVRTILDRHHEVFSEYRIFVIFFGWKFFWSLKKTPVSLNYREDNGAFLPIAPSYFTV
jgi:hypothetical protein